MKTFSILVASAFVGVVSVAQAADIEAGKAKAAACAGCHGADGIATKPSYPNLAGQNAEYLVASMMAYKTDARSHAVMKAMVSGLSDEDIANIAAYYESLKK
ncbi:MAG: hypothetical protein AXA67_13290 [Methylothermaceae bacteria B42]|nr:MAG: hypothetical protein AXA67_13290 [Methylothermaceae bacteria B42]HHJ38402.1 c-type cytochrome [Methylothermaceae bacterium]